jgi:hypothetical protein
MSPAARPPFRDRSSRNAHRSTYRHVRSTSAAHVFRFQRRAPTPRAAIGSTLRVQACTMDFRALRWTTLTHGGQPASADRNTWSWTLSVLTPRHSGRASDTPSPPLCFQPRRTLCSGSVETAFNVCLRERNTPSPAQDAFHRQQPRRAVHETAACTADPLLDAVRLGCGLFPAPFD